jgi:hypothetical protein
MNVRGWRIFTQEEMRHYLETNIARVKTGTGDSRYRSDLAVRRAFSPVDIYCYLKARFGKPNGFQTSLAKDSSDNWIHWDYNLKVDEEDVYISGTSREVIFVLSESVEDQDWFSLFDQIKADFGRVGAQKSAILKSLEKWIIFPNKYVALSDVCADLHAKVLEDINLLTPGALEFPWTDDPESKEALRYQDLVRRISDLYQNSLKLSLITPVLAEAFLNMMILALCHPDVRQNVRQFEAFLRAQIDVKIFDLSLKCRGFIKKIDADDSIYKKFKRVMDKRNHTIHGNIEPEKERVEFVYFDRRRPLFEEPGDHIAKRLEAPFRQYTPKEIIQDYEDTHAFLQSLGDHLEPKMRDGFWQVMGDPYPGYDMSRKIVGAVLPVRTIMGHLGGMRYDDELMKNIDAGE